MGPPTPRLLRRLDEECVSSLSAFPAFSSLPSNSPAFILCPFHFAADLSFRAQIIHPHRTPPLLSRDANSSLKISRTAQVRPPLLVLFANALSSQVPLPFCLAPRPYPLPSFSLYIPSLLLVLSPSSSSSSSPSHLLPLPLFFSRPCFSACDEDEITDSH